MKFLNKRVVVILIITALLLLIPLTAMQFSDEVNWSVSDFIIMGTALLLVGFGYNWISQKSKKMQFKLATAFAILGAFLLFWVNAAVGIIGNENQTANLLYFSVFLILIIGIGISKFKAKKLAFTMFFASGVQLLIPVIALIIWPPPTISWSPGVLGVFIFSSIFTIIFACSGFLFLHSHTTNNL